MKRLALFAVVILCPLLFLILISPGCSSDPTTASEQHRGNATVIERDGTTITGAIVANTGAGITLATKDGVQHAIPMEKVRTIEYEDLSPPHGTPGTEGD